MNDEDRKILIDLVMKNIETNARLFMSHGYLRYEAIRKLNPRQFAEIHARNLKGEFFDDMIDELIIKNHKGGK